MWALTGSFLVLQFFSLLEENYPETLKFMLIVKGVWQVTAPLCAPAPYLNSEDNNNAFFPGSRQAGWLLGCMQIRVPGTE